MSLCIVERLTFFQYKLSRILFLFFLYFILLFDHCILINISTATCTWLRLTAINKETWWRRWWWWWWWWWRWWRCHKNIITKRWTLSTAALSKRHSLSGEWKITNKNAALNCGHWRASTFQQNSSFKEAQLTCESFVWHCAVSLYKTANSVIVIHGISILSARHSWSRSNFGYIIRLNNTTIPYLFTY